MGKGRPWRSRKPQPKLARKQNPNSLQPNGQLSKKARRRRARKLKAKAGEGASHSTIAVEVVGKNTTESGINSDLNRNDDEKGGPSSQKSKSTLEAGENGDLNRNDNEKRGASSQRSKSTLESDKNSGLTLINNEKGESSFQKSDNTRKKKEKHEATRVDHGRDSEKDAAGLILMCNSKTKPDCFRYKIMAVSAGNKQVVLRIKPGLKLFLYDFDLKLLYGTFEASSAGGMNLEPAAFDGSFPAQVRFRVYEDCLPLPESAFKKAIKENYDEGTNEFRTELTSEQVTKLESLFRPILQPSSSSTPLYVTENEYRSFALRHSFHGPRQATIPYATIPEPSRNIHYRVQNLRNPNPIYQDAFSRKAQLSRDPAVAYAEIPSVQEQIVGEPALRYGSLSSLQDPSICPRAVYPRENEYQMYGLRGRTDPSEIHFERSRQVDHYLDNKYLSDGHHAYSSSPYLRSSGGLTGYEVCSQATVTTLLPTVATNGKPGVHTIDYTLSRNVVNGIHSSQTSHDMSYYNQRSHQIGGLAGNGSEPVSSRYSFAGASYSYR